MKKREKVSHIMTKNLKTVDVLKNDLHDAKSMMETHGIRHLPVLNNGDLIGIISLTDIMRISYGASYGQEGLVEKAIFDAMNIAQVMAYHPTTINSLTTIKEAAEILSTKEFHALPVVDNGQLIGIVTSTDLIKYLLEQY